MQNHTSYYIREFSSCKSYSSAKSLEKNESLWQSTMFWLLRVDHRSGKLRNRSLNIYINQWKQVQCFGNFPFNASVKQSRNSSYHVVELLRLSSVWKQMTLLFGEKITYITTLEQQNSAPSDEAPNLKKKTNLGNSRLDNIHNLTVCDFAARISYLFIVQRWHLHRILHLAEVNEVDVRCKAVPLPWEVGLRGTW